MFVLIQQIDVDACMRVKCILFVSILNMHMYQYSNENEIIVVLTTSLICSLSYINVCSTVFCPLLSHNLFMFCTEDISNVNPSFYSTTFFSFQWTIEKKNQINTYYIKLEYCQFVTYPKIRYCSILYIDGICPIANLLVG